MRSAEIECVRANPALDTPSEGPLLAAIAAAQQAVGLGRRIATKATCTEAGLLATAGLEAVVLGPGESVGNVHRPNECTRMSQLWQARDLYRETIRRLCIDAPGGDACSS